MKKIIFLSLAMILIASTSVAQDVKAKRQSDPIVPVIEEPTTQESTNYYPNTSGTITMSGYTYKYRNDRVGEVEVSSRIELYNVASSFLDVKWGYKDGASMSFEKQMGKDNTPDFTSASQTIAQTLEMVKGLFSTSEKNLLRGKSMLITVRFNSSTGTIADVYFDFFRDSPFVNISVETYRSVELALKQNLTIAVTDEGRRLNYISLFWSQKF
jgi:hypothetical protein